MHIPVHPEFLKNETKNETSFETEVKRILKLKDYKKLQPLIEFMNEGKEISIQDAINITGKSKATVWRYLQLLSDTGLIESNGNTKKLYRKK